VNGGFTRGNRFYSNRTWPYVNLYIQRRRLQSLGILDRAQDYDPYTLDMLVAVDVVMGKLREEEQKRQEMKNRTR